ncbi:MAG: class I SAM-dependent methyltransferase [Actinophytocola sp.]|nr:class I SAM-dependent methyltransferase [Actinophytocola sp.]
MKTSAWSRRVASSPLAPVVAFPIRTKDVAKHDAKVLKTSIRWLFTSREHTNYTYELTERNRRHLAWYIAAVTGAATHDVRLWFDEVEQDDDLRALLMDGVATGSRRGLADRTVRYGRRIGWYALIRALKPKHVVESGIDKGLGSCLIAAALLQNAAEGHPGRLSALDINPDAGYLIRGDYREVVDVVVGDSLENIPKLRTPVDLFIHDSWHSEEHESAEFSLVEDKLAPSAVLLTDNAAETDVLLRLAEQTGRKFLYFQEEPDRHWHPGDGTGIAWSRNGS